MVNLSLDEEVIKELYTNDLDVKQEFSKMDAFMFVYCAKNHLKDCVYITSYWQECDDHYLDKALMWLNFWENYRVN
ncbi:MAG: hypothetical protein Q8N99_06695 [Nanoarchaeota archaeon]|nr:hypothetical protein [Nanoarchaeota archaeon]